MNWQDVCENRTLQDLPFKIELNRWGQIVMSPAKLKHSFYQGRIQFWLERLVITGVTMPECAIETTDGVKVADVVWLSDKICDRILEETAASVAPEICVEVKSASNTLEEMTEKKQLYFAAGAEEVWYCNEQGEMRFYNPQGELERSQLVPEFPTEIKRQRAN
ncbi:Uma2 family endonuclease [Roseofilum casamattae]|uniref:Uma2 family endonuclease n=1 Tax=Roseofilum casamattae BLCC-M143 TaxID=3022442 RepID=A0ABT7BZC8_9CYAN|nr:Uma2 family endonuclease [Roseofilum casamattae]MDJ1184560.1 Uma2 family endonuclease [Roseofilum casamattae BLCC-M143]